MSGINNKLDADQVIRQVYDPITESLKTTTTVTGGSDATAANQVIGNNSLSSIDGKQTTANTTLTAISNKIQSSLVSASYDYIATTYVGATTNINTVVYKLGGAAGTTVATLTMGYDGSNRLISVTKT